MRVVANDWPLVGRSRAVIVPARQENKIIWMMTKAPSEVSQDVFFESDEFGRIHLVEGNHAGNHFFRSLAELNRTRFVTHNVGDRVTLSIVHTIWNKGKGKIYIRNPDENDEWTEVSKIGNAQTIVSKALESLLEIPRPRQEEGGGVPSDFVAMTTTTNEQPAVEPSINEQESSIPEQEVSDATERRHSARTLIGASSLLMIQSVRAELEQDYEEAEEKEEKEALQVKFENTNIAMIESFDSNSSSSTPSSPEPDHAKAAASIPKSKPERRRRSACPASDFVSEQPGIEFANVKPYDVLCGGSGEGVLATRHEGNKRFLKVVEAELEDFYSADDKTKLRIAQQVVEGGNPRGRFLAYNPDSGLWHELKRDKAWFKSLRTFLKREKRDTGMEEGDQKRQSLSRPRREH